MTRAIYCRVSTGSQSTDVQVARLKQLAPDAVVYADDGVSGARLARPELDKLRAGIRAGLVQEVFVTKLDRLSRSVRDALEFYELCEAYGCRIVVADQGFDSATPQGRFMRTVLLAFGELERELIVSRTQEIMDAIKSGTRRTRSGRPPGRPRRMTPEVVDQVRHLRYELKLPWSTVAMRLHIPAGTARKVRPAPPSTTPRVENGPYEFRASSGEPRAIPED